ncbi:heterogeneous nuclear ribonucleoprotein L-like [Ochlerotatus camptorhynchus]|uniref:heterogeneous nuclear ribonucleoprotein L-like n=1 Tax=Ochlerotatus camptorhynchus TaxID=644619 RepID=UPI0031E2D9F2
MPATDEIRCYTILPSSAEGRPRQSLSSVGLMKDAPLIRNGPANFIQPAQQQGAVMMVYGLDNNTAHTDMLFNLFCLYGNVVRIKFVKTKGGTAMIQMGYAIAVERSIQHLNTCHSEMMVAKVRLHFPSRTTCQSPLTPTPCRTIRSAQLKDYSAFTNNRLLSLNQASTNRILHFFNSPPGMSEDLLLTAFTTKDYHPSQVRMFPLESESSSGGLVEFPSVSLAVNAIMKCNHSAIDHKGTKFPFIMKL